MRSKDELLEELRNLFRSTLAAAAAGTNHARTSRIRGCVDGYMRALMDLGVASQSELLAIVAAERERANGPAVATFDGNADESAAA